MSNLREVIDVECKKAIKEGLKQRSQTRGPRTSKNSAVFFNSLTICLFFNYF